MKRIRFIHIILLLLFLAMVKTASIEGEDAPPVEKPSRKAKVRPPRAVSAPVVVRVNPTHELTAFGENVEDAHKNAIDKAVDWVADYLTAQWGESTWKPTAGLLQQLDVVHSLGAPEIVPRDDNRKGTRVAVEVELTPQALQVMHQEIRQIRRDERLHLASRLLVGLMAFLGVTYFYLKLEDISKGYYSQGLRVIALTILTATAIYLLRMG